MACARRRTRTIVIIGLPLVAAILLASCTDSNGGARTRTEPASTSVPPNASNRPTASAPSAPQPTSTTLAAPADWPTYHGDVTRTGYASTLKAVSATPRKAWSVDLDGAVYGSPIVVAGGVTIAVTENNSVYRIDAGKVIWRNHIGAPVPRSSLPCGNIDPTGITSTPTYDPATRTLIVVAFMQNPFRHIAVGLDPATGQQRWDRNVDVPASVPGITPRAMQQRGALLVSGRRVYVPYGGLAGDCSSYRGSVVGVDLDQPDTAALWHFTVPTSREAGIWASPGISENPGGGLLVAVGNGDTAGTGSYDHSDSVLKLDGEQIADAFSPSGWLQDNAQDLDLGSQGPTVVGDWVFIAGKSGTAYVLDRSKLGGIGGQKSATALCRSFGGTAVVADVVYVPCDDGVRAVRINADASLTLLWRFPAASGSPVVGGGRVWALDTSNGVLRMVDPATGADRGALPVAAVTRFATPALYGDSVLIGTTTGLVAYAW